MMKAMRFLLLAWVLVGCGSVSSSEDATGAAGAAGGAGGAAVVMGAAGNGGLTGDSGAAGTVGRAGAGGAPQGLPSCTEYPEANGNAILSVQGCGAGGLVFVDPVRGTLPCALCAHNGPGYAEACIVEIKDRRNAMPYYCVVAVDAAGFSTNCESHVPAPGGCHAP
jgi:hypothetical protein